MKRRTFLKGVGATAAGTALGVWPNTARAAWGDIPSGVWSGVTPAKKVLEIFLWGGMAPFESFYYRDVNNSRTRGFDPDVQSLTWNADALCGGNAPSGLQASAAALGIDAQTKAVKLGPFAKPLWNRPDIFSKTRTVVLSHSLLPHEAAIPFGVTGRTLGSPDFTGLGAPVARKARLATPLADHPLPYAYVLGTTGALTNAMFSGLTAVGNHGGGAKPLPLALGGTFDSFTSKLGRPGITGNADQLLEHYRASYRDWLRKSGQVTRSTAFSEYDAAVTALFGSPQLVGLLDSSLPGDQGVVPACSRSTQPAFGTGNDVTRRAIRIGSYLLSRTGAEETRYVGIIDGGLDALGFAYDVHSFDQARRTSTHLWNVLEQLQRVIKDPANPSPDDANKIDLAETLIVIKTEFGRTPYRSTNRLPDSASNGRDHWPEAYAVALIGGPVGQGVSGSIVDGTSAAAIADASFKPTDFQAASLLAAGVDPFAPGNFQVGQLTGALQSVGSTAHELSMEKLRQQILGV